MNKRPKLTKQLSEEQFNRGYWYTNELKDFGKKIGIPNSSRLRKDELEKLIKTFLRTGKVKGADRKNIKKSGPKDIEKGLNSTLPIVNYTSNKKTKKFIIEEARKKVPGLKIKSGVWYRLNRWRDEQITNERKITYGDLVEHFVELNQTEGSFKKVPVVRYINFVAEYLANEKNATRKQAIAEWEKLKTLDVKKDYSSWKKYMNQNPNR